MIQNVPQIVYAVIGSIIVAVMSAWITARLSLRQFKSQRFWELKVEMYKTIYDALYHLDAFIRRKRLEQISDQTIGGETPQKLYDDYSAAFDQLNRVIFQGSFIISRDSITILKQLLLKLNIQKPPDLSDSFSKYEEINKYFKERIGYMSESFEKLNIVINTDLRMK